MPEYFKESNKKLLYLSDVIGEKETLELLEVISGNIHGIVVFKNVLIAVNKSIGITLPEIRKKRKQSIKRIMAIDIIAKIMKDHTDLTNKEIAELLNYYEVGIGRAIKRFNRLSDKIPYEKKELEKYRATVDEFEKLKDNK